MKKRFSLIPLCVLALSSLSSMDAAAETFVPLCGKSSLQAQTCLDLSKSKVAFYDGALAVELDAAGLSIQASEIGLVMTPAELSVDAATPIEAVVARGSDGRWGVGMNGLKEMAEFQPTGNPNSVSIAAADGYVSVEVWNQPVRGLSIFDARPGKGVRTHPRGEAEVRTNPKGQAEFADSITIDPNPSGLLDAGQAGDNIIDEGEAGENLFPQVRILIDTDASRTGRDPQSGVWGGVSVDVAGERIVDNAPFDVQVVAGLLPFVTDSLKLGSEVAIGQLTFAGDHAFVLENEGSISQLHAIEGATLAIFGSGSVGTGLGTKPMPIGK